jgi:hypothetical protein
MMKNGRLKVNNIEICRSVVASNTELDEPKQFVWECECGWSGCAVHLLVGHNCPKCGKFEKICVRWIGANKQLLKNQSTN